MGCVKWGCDHACGPRYCALAPLAGRERLGTRHVKDRVRGTRGKAAPHASICSSPHPLPARLRHSASLRAFTPRLRRAMDARKRAYGGGGGAPRGATADVPAPLPSPSARLVAAGSVMAASAMTAMLTVRYMRVSLVWKAHRSTPQPRAGSIRSLLWLIRLPRRSRLRPTRERTVSRLGLFVALAVCFAAGYVLAGLWSRARDTTPLAQICPPVDYVTRLQENLKDQAPPS